MSSVFEPSYIWNRDEEKKSCFARFLSKKKESGPEIFKKSFKGMEYQKLEEGSVQLRTLKIADLDDGSHLVILKWSNETKSIEKRFVKEAQAEQFLSEALHKTNYRVGELFLELKKFRFDSNKTKISTGKLSMRMENLEILEWWIQKMDVEKSGELNIQPFGEKALDIPKRVFDMPQFQQLRVLRLMEHCSFSSDQFLSFCSSTPHFSFFSNAISESVARSALEKCQEQKDFVVLEWFFSAKIDTERVIKELVRPKGERKERLNIQTQSFDPVEVFSMASNSNENDRKVSVMIVEDVATLRPYSLVLYA